jgi:hypothetical protein
MKLVLLAGLNCGKTWLTKYTNFYSVSDDITTLSEAYVFSISQFGASTGYGQANTT